MCILSLGKQISDPVALKLSRASPFPRATRASDRYGMYNHVLVTAAKHVHTRVVVIFLLVLSWYKLPMAMDGRAMLEESQSCRQRSLRHDKPLANANDFSTTLPDARRRCANERKSQAALHSNSSTIGQEHVCLKCVALIASAHP